MHKIYINGKDFCREGMENKLPSLSTDLAYAVLEAWQISCERNIDATIEVYVDGMDCGNIYINTNGDDMPLYKRKFFDKVFALMRMSSIYKTHITFQGVEKTCYINASSIYRKLVDTPALNDIDWESVK